MEINSKLMYRITHIFFKGMSTLYNKQKWVIALFFVTAYILGVIGINESIQLSKPKINESLFSSVWLLALENLFVQLPGELSNLKVVTAQFIAYIALLLTIVLALFKEWVILLKLKTLAQVKHTLVIGLGENNRTYLESELNSSSDGSFIIIEPDAGNIHAKYFMENGIGVFFGTLDEYKVQFKHLSRVVISTGNDRANIEIAGKLIGMIPAEMTKKSFGCTTVVHIHLQNQDYKALFHQKILNNRKDLPLEFKPYSFNDETARALFEKHTILGNFHALAQRTTPYNIAIVGEGDLAERIIYHLCMLANLPNKNHLTIHCVNENPAAFISRLHSDSVNLSKITTVSFKEHELSLQDQSFYLSKLWKVDNLTNVFVCHDDENINLECVVNLHDKVYLQEAVQKTMKTKVHFAMYHNLELSRTINENREEFKEFFTFGDAKQICSKEHFIDEKYEKIAKSIHFGYAEVYKKNMLLYVDDTKNGEEITRKWQNSTSFNKRESNRSQALHINTKLMSLGLKKVEVDIKNYSENELLQHNQKIMQSSRDKFEISDDEIVDISKRLYSKNEDDHEIIETFFTNIGVMEDVYSKLVNAEHERWLAFHYLNGWSFNIHRNDKIKHHDCLLPFAKFSGFDRRKTIIYDLYSILYIPNYLASTGYRIVPIEDVTIGIIGKTNSKTPVKALETCFKTRLEKLISAHGNVKLISSLSEGTARSFVDLALEIDSQKIKQLIVPMPFNKEDYKRDFTEIGSKEQFEYYLNSYADNRKYPFKVNVFSLTEGNRQIEIKTRYKKCLNFFSSQKKSNPCNFLYCIWLKLKNQSKDLERYSKYKSVLQPIHDQKQYKDSEKFVFKNSDVLFVIDNNETMESLKKLIKDCANESTNMQCKKIIYILQSTP